MSKKRKKYQLKAKYFEIKRNLPETVRDDENLVNRVQNGKFYYQVFTTKDGELAYNVVELRATKPKRYKILENEREIAAKSTDYQSRRCRFFTAWQNGQTYRFRRLGSLERVYDIWANLTDHWEYYGITNDARQEPAESTRKPNND